MEEKEEGKGKERKKKERKKKAIKKEREEKGEEAEEVGEKEKKKRKKNKTTQIEEMENTINKLKAQIKTLSQENEELKSKNEELQEENKNLKPAGNINEDPVCNAKTELTEEETNALMLDFSKQIENTTTMAELVKSDKIKNKIKDALPEIMNKKVSELTGNTKAELFMYLRNEVFGKEVKIVIS